MCRGRRDGKRTNSNALRIHNQRNKICYNNSFRQYEFYCGSRFLLQLTIDFCFIFDAISEQIHAPFAGVDYDEDCIIELSKDEYEGLGEGDDFAGIDVGGGGGYEGKMKEAVAVVVVVVVLVVIVEEETVVDVVVVVDVEVAVDVEVVAGADEVVALAVEAKVMVDGGCGGGGGGSGGCGGGD